MYVCVCMCVCVYIQAGFKSGKEYIKTVYCHPAYLTYMQSTLYEMLDWIKQKIGRAHV